MAPSHQADHHHDEHGHHAHDERDPGAVDDTRGYVPPQLVGTEGMVQRRRLQALLSDRGRIDRYGIAQPVRGPKIGGDRDHDDDE